MANDIDKTSPHYKGDFGSIYEVNKKFPTGGVAGDFVVIEGWAHYWNADRATWCVNAERDSYWDELITNISDSQKKIKEELGKKADSATVDAELVKVRASISAEIQDRKDAIAAEAKARNDAIADEVLARTTAITEAIEAEAQARGTAISDEATARSEADKALQTAMDKNVTELKGADTEHESRLLALEQSEWPLSLELTINPILIEFTGSEKDASVSWKIMRKGVGVTPTVLTFKQDGVALSAELSANGSINAKVNKLGDTVFEIAVEAEGMKKSASKKLTMVLPVYMGFAGASDAAGLAITELSKYAPLASPAGTYKIKNNADGIYLWLCVPDTMTINKVTSSGFTVPMREVQTGQTELGGYKCYRSSNAIVAGEYTYTIS